MTEQEEEFLHLAICIKNLNSSWRILQELKIQKTTPTLINVAFQFTLIEYSKSYKTSFGKTLDKKGKQRKYLLDTQFIPEEYLELHKRILIARDQLHAHSDLTLLEANVYVIDSEYGKSVNYSSNIIYGTEEFENIELIIDLIERTVDALYKKEKQIKQQLPLN